MTTPTTFPLSLSAKTREELSKEMLKNNLKYNAHFAYFDIQKAGAEWVAWFNIDVNTHQLLIREMTDGSNNRG